MFRAKRLSAFVLCVWASGVVSTSALAGVTITIEEVGNDVVMSGGGSLDLSSWTIFVPGIGMPGLKPDDGVALGPGPQHSVDLYFMPQNFNGPSNIGPGTTHFTANSGAGDPTGLGWIAPPGLTEIIAVPANYQSGDPIIGSTATFANESFASIGIAPGSYMWTWDTATGGSDFFLIDVEVPAPGALALLGMAGLLLRRRRA